MTLEVQRDVVNNYMSRCIQYGAILPANEQ